ncbi:MAG: hypothetical protein V3S68_00130 [Dehalococcoidia bacterium]
MLSLLRAGAALLLGVTILVGFLFFLILNNVSDKLLNADFYKDNIAGQDTYNRIYDEVLVDEELVDKTKEFLGDVQIVSHEDIVGLTREIIPPAYIQQHVEENIERAIAYGKQDVDRLDVYIDLSEPLRNVKPVMFVYIDSRIDELREEDPGISSCSPETLTGLAGRYLDIFTGLAGGEVPLSVPSLRALDPLCRQLLFSSSFDLLIGSSTLDAETTQQLIANREELRVLFEAGDTLEVLKVAARILAEPLMDDAIEEVRADLSPGDRLDLIHQIAEWNPDTSEEQIRADLDEGRKWISRADSFGKLTTLIMVIGGSILMGLVFYPNLANMLRWPGITLFFTGVAFFVVGKIAESKVPARLADVIETGAGRVTDVPQAVTDLGGDLLISFGTQIASGIAGPSVNLMIIGAVLIGASFFTGPIKLGLRGIKKTIPFLNKPAQTAPPR